MDSTNSLTNPKEFLHVVLTLFFTSKIGLVLQVIRLESQYPNRIRYLTIVSAFGPDEEEQSIVMGVDWIDK